MRLEQDPFPLYPGEVLTLTITALPVVPVLSAMKLKVVRDFTDEVTKEERRVGEEFLFEGPGVYIPRKEVQMAPTLSQAYIIKPNEALKMRANRETVDRDGNKRVAGEEWLVRKAGAYLPGAYEQVIATMKASILTEKNAIHVKALKSFKDQLGKQRKNGEEYLIRLEEMESFIPDVYEEAVSEVEITTLTSREYCVILNPVNENGKPQLGHKKLIKGEQSFFLQPGEDLENGIQEVYVLGDDEGLVLRALDKHVDNSVDPAINRKPGDKWMLKGPMEYVPPVEIEVLDSRKAIPLHQNEGIYVRNNKTGAVRAVIGQTYMLGEDEELWAKSIPPIVKTLLDRNRDTMADRGDYINNQSKINHRHGVNSQAAKKSTTDIESLESSRVVTFQVSNNSAVQIYDYKSKKSRVVFGPDLVMLEPNEELTQISLSGGKPKKSNCIRAVALILGPDFSTDIYQVETADHARLQIELSFNWHFDIKDKNDPKEAAKLFCVPDFIGDMCKSIGSKIRGDVSAVSFDNFHKHSAKIITNAVFGLDERGEVKSELRFPASNLVVTSVDVKSVEPSDQRTRDSLQKSVTLAIEITTQSQEAAAKREAERVDQEARGKLERQRIMDDAEAEKARMNLLTLQGESAAVESTGQAKAEATGRAEAAKIEAMAAVEAAKLKAEAMTIESDSELARLKAAREAEIQFLNDQNRLEVEKAEKMAGIESAKFKAMVDVMGSDTIKSMASAPQDHQVKMLQALGLNSTLITDGKNPVNLFNTAQGLLGSIKGSNPM